MNLSPAERVRSMLAVSLELLLDGERHGRHVVTPDGSLLLRDAATAGPRDPGEQVVLSGSDVASVPQPYRVRGAFRMHGTVRLWSGPRPAGIVAHLGGPGAVLDQVRIVRFQPTSIALAWHCEPGSNAADPLWRRVDLEEYATAAPDPLVGAEQRWLPHLQHDHEAELRQLAARAYPALDDTVGVRALVLDRHGVVLRLYADQGRLDTRVGFPDPATCACEVRAAFAGLLGHTSS
jgi:hypothetical protein